MNLDDFKKFGKNNGEEQDDASKNMQTVLNPIINEYDKYQKKENEKFINGIKDSIGKMINGSKEGEKEESSEEEHFSDDFNNSNPSKPTDYTSREEKIASVDDLRMDDLGTMSQLAQEWDFFEYENFVYSDQMAATKFLAERDHFLQTGEVRDSHLYDPNTDKSLENVGNGKFVDSSSYNKTLDANIKANPNVELEKIEEATKKSYQNENVPGIQSKWAEGQEPVANFGEKIDIDEVRRTRDELKEFKAIRQEMEGPTLGGAGVSNAPINEDLAMAVEEDVLNQGIEEELEFGERENSSEVFREKETPSEEENLVEEGDVRELSRESEKEDHIQEKSFTKEESLDEGTKQYEDVSFEKTSEQGVDSVELNENSTSINYTQNSYAQETESSVEMESFEDELDAELERTRQQDGNAYENLKQQEQPKQEESIDDVSLDEDKDVKSNNKKEPENSDVAKQKSTQSVDSVDTNKSYQATNYQQQSASVSSEMEATSDTDKEADLDMERERSASEENAYKKLEEERAAKQSAEDAKKAEEQATADAKNSESSKEKENAKRKDVDAKSANKNGQNLNTSKMYDASNYQKNAAEAQSASIAAEKVEQDAEMEMERTRTEQEARNEASEIRRKNEEQAKQIAEKEKSETVARERDAEKKKQDSKIKPDAKSRQGLNKNDSRVDMKQVTKTTSNSKTVTKTKTEIIDVLKVKNNNLNKQSSSATANMIKKAEANKAASRQFGGALGSMGTVAGGISGGAQSVGNVITSDNQAEAIAEEFKNKATKQLTKVVKRTTKKVVKKGGEKLRKEAQRRAAEKVAKKTAEKTVKTATKAATKAAAAGAKAGASAAAGAATGGIGTAAMAALEAKNKVKDSIRNLFTSGGKPEEKKKIGFVKRFGIKFGIKGIKLAIGVFAAFAPIILAVILIATVIGGGGTIGGILISKFGSDVVSILDGSWTFIGKRYQALSEFNYAQMIADDVCEVLGETFVESAKNDAQFHFVSGDYKIPSPQKDDSGHRLYNWYADISEGGIGYVWMREQCDKNTKTDGTITNDFSGEKLFTETGYLHRETNEPYYYLANKDARMSITPNANIVPIMSMAHDRYDDSWSFDNFKAIEAYVYYMYALSHNSAHYESTNVNDTYSYTFEDAHSKDELFDLTQWSWKDTTGQGWQKSTSTLIRPLPFSLVSGASSTDIRNGTYQFSDCSNIYIHGYKKDDFFGASDNTKAMIDKAKSVGKKVLSFLDGFAGTDLASFVQQAGVYRVHMYEDASSGKIIYKNLTTGEDGIEDLNKIIYDVVNGYTQYCDNAGFDSWTKTGTICGKDSDPRHTHSASCWNTQCGKAYHIHTASCFQRTCVERDDSCHCGGRHNSRNKSECTNWSGGHSHGTDPDFSSITHNLPFSENGCSFERKGSCPGYHIHDDYCYDLVVFCKGHCGGHIKPTINLAVTYTFEGLAYQDAVTIDKDQSKARFICTEDFEKRNFKTQKTVANWSKKVTNQVNKFFDPFPNGPLSALCWAGEGIEAGIMKLYGLWYGLWHDGDDNLSGYDVTSDSSKTSRAPGQDDQGFTGWFVQEPGDAPKLDLGRIGELYDLYGTPEDFYKQGIDIWKDFDVDFQIGFGETLTPTEIQDIINAIREAYPSLSSARESVIRDALEHVGMYIYQCDSDGHYNGMYADAGPSECTGFVSGVYMRALGSKCGFWNDVSSSFTSDTGESGTISGKGSGGIHHNYGYGYGGRVGNGTGGYQVPSVYYLDGKRPLGRYWGGSVSYYRKPGDVVSRDPVDGNGHSMIYLGHFTDPISGVEGDYVVDCSSDTEGSSYRMYTSSDPNKINDYKAVYSPFVHFRID